MDDGKTEDVPRFLRFTGLAVSQALLLFPCLMTLHEDGFDGGSVTASAQLPIPNAPGNIHRRIVVSMSLEPAHLAAERPLIRSVFAVRVMAHTAFLGRICTDDRGRHVPHVSDYSR